VSPPPEPDPAAADRLAAAARRLVDLVRRSRAEAGSADRACAAIEEACEALEPTAVEGRAWHQRGLLFEGFQSGEFGGEPPSDFAAFFPYSPLVGPRNPLAPPAELEVREGRVFGRVRPGPAYNGPPGCVHGGVIASIFDELLGCTNLTNGLGGMTGTLRIVYRAPAPIDTELGLEGWVERVEGRKVFTRGTLHSDETLCAEADGIFIQGAVQRHAEALAGTGTGG